MIYKIVIPVRGDGKGDNVLAHAGVTLGETYPKPIVNLASSRNDALAAFKSLKGEG